MPGVSIIVPCYNAERFIRATVESVRRQTRDDWELILLDDGSRDATAEIITELAQTDARMRAVLKKNEGTCRTRNRGFQESDAASPYVLFLDHDDQIVPEFLATMCGYLDRQPEVGLVACQYEDVSEDGARLGTGHRSRWVPGRFLPRELRADEIDTPFVSFYCTTGQGPFAVYRRSVLERTSGWEESFWPHEDSDMFCQMALLAPVHYLPDRLYLKRVHPHQGMADPDRVYAAYAAFRQKWDVFEPRTADERVALEAARRHYRTRHLPLRDLKVAAVSFREFLRTGRSKPLRWSLRCLGTAVAGLAWRAQRTG